MVSTCRLQEKYNQVQRNFCFYLDIQDNDIARTLSKRIEDLGLQQEYFLTGRVTHVVRSGGAAGARWAPRDAPRSRADAMLQRVPPETHAPRDTTPRVTLDLQQAVILLDKIYDTFFSAPSKANNRVFRKHFIKIEFLDKLCRPVYKEFDEWPDLALEPDPPRDKKPSPAEDNLNNNNNLGQKMTRKSRPRIKEREEREAKGGYCEMCNAEYADAALHRRSPHHLAFVRDHHNYVALDELIAAGGDVAAFLGRAAPLNGERRSLRHAVCNGDLRKSPDSTLNGNHSPRRNGIDDDKKHNTRCKKRTCDSTTDDSRQYYKVVSTKLRSSGGFVTKEPKKESPPMVNGSKPLVVKFRKIRRSELSVLSDEAEQFMFPKRASSTSSTSSDEDEEEEKPRPKSKTPPQPPISLERRRLARPMALKEESSEEDSWPEDKRRRKRPTPVVKKVKRLRKTASAPEAAVEEPEPPAPPGEPATAPGEPATAPGEPATAPGEPVSPLREEPSERCVKWEAGRLRYTPAVERLQFAFESAPRAEPWFAAFSRQDRGARPVRDLPAYFSLYSKSPKLPYEIGTLPPLKPNCCPLSDLVRPERGPHRAYGTRGMKQQKMKKRTLALLALESHPRKSPREHASTLAMLGGRRRLPDDTSEDTASETASTAAVARPERALPELREASERLQLFLSSALEDAAEYELSDGGEGEPALQHAPPDLPRLVRDCDACDPLRDELRAAPPPAPAPRRARRRARPKNRTGWPVKKRVKKEGSSRSTEGEPEPASQPSSAADDSASEEERATTDDDEHPLQADVKEEALERAPEPEEAPPPAKPRRVAGAVPAWLQPVVRVARVEGPRLRSARGGGGGRARRARPR